MKYIYILNTLNNEMLKAKVEKETSLTYFYKHKSFEGTEVVNKNGTEIIKVFHEFNDAKMYLIGDAAYDLVEAEKKVLEAVAKIDEIEALKESDI